MEIAAALRAFLTRCLGTGGIDALTPRSRSGARVAALRTELLTVVGNLTTVSELTELISDHARTGE
jgi:hypothetical protein